MYGRFRTAANITPVTPEGATPATARQQAASSGILRQWRATTTTQAASANYIFCCRNDNVAELSDTAAVLHVA